MFDVLRYPVSGTSPLKRFATGVVLSALGILIVPAIFVAGYYGRILVASAAGNRQAPTFDDWPSLFVQGLKTWAVVGVYLTLALITAVSLGMAAMLLGSLGLGAGAAVGLVAWVLAGAVVVGFFLIPTWFFLPAAMTRAGRIDDIGAALDVRLIGRIAVNRRYLANWSAGLVVLAIGSTAYVFVGGMNWFVESMNWLPPMLPVASSVSPTVGMSPLLGHLFGVTVNFYCHLTAFHLFGRGYAAALDTIADDGRPSRRDGTSRDDESVDRHANDEWGAAARRWRERRREERRGRIDQPSERDPTHQQQDT